MRIFYFLLTMISIFNFTRFSWRSEFNSAIDLLMDSTQFLLHFEQVGENCC